MYEHLPEKLAINPDRTKNMQGFKLSTFKFASAFSLWFLVFREVALTAKVFAVLYAAPRRVAIVHRILANYYIYNIYINGDVVYKSYEDMWRLLQKHYANRASLLR